jgi:hypothetical protein
MSIAADTFCNVCGECPADCIVAEQPMCYLCRNNRAKAIREQEALLAVTKEAGNYVDAEQAAYYSAKTPPMTFHRGPDTCEDYYSGCECDRCNEREDWVNGGGR